jgi:glycosyltransferase involved in cell wall biosynthesis
MKNIILIEPILYGHHAMYLRYFAEVLLSLNCRVTVLSQDKNLVRKLIPSFAGEKNLKVENIRYQNLKSVLGTGIGKKIKVISNLFIISSNLLGLRKYLKKDDPVFFCCIDDYLHELLPRRIFERLLPVDWAGLFLQSNSSHKFSRFDKRKLFFHSKCKCIGVLGDASPEFKKNFGNKIINFPDITDETEPNRCFELARTIKQRAGNRKIISLVGALASRKGLVTLINAALKMDPARYFFMIAGEGAHAITDKETFLIDSSFKEKENCCYSPVKIPTEADFNALIAISDIIYAAYVNFEGSSNMLTKASLFKKPIVVSKGFYMEKIVRKYRIGLAIDQDSPDQCADAIEKLSSGHFNETFEPEFERYSELNSKSRLEEVFSLFLNKINQ